MAHVVRDDIDLLDGNWYATRPYEQWAWMRANAPVYYDEPNDVWGITRYDDVLAIEKDPATFSSARAPRPHGDPLPMMISMDNPEHQTRRIVGEPRVHAEEGAGPRRVHQRLVHRRSSTG